MIKYITLLLLFLTNFLLAQNSVDLLIKNPTVNGNKFKWEVHVVLTGNLGSENNNILGSSSWFFNFNKNALINPVLVYILPDISQANGYTNSTGIVSDKIEITTIFDSSFNGKVLSVGEDYHLFTIETDILNKNQQANVTWDSINTGIFNIEDISILENYLGSADVPLPVKKKDDLPKEFQLYQNFPNPFNPSTNISFSLPKESKVLINIYNLLGRKVFSLLNKNLSAGYHHLTFNTTKENHNLVSGVYIYTISAGNFFDAKKMILLK